MKIPMKISAKWIELLFVSGLALIPVLWFMPGHWVFGTDAAFPPNPVEVFWRRQFVWNQVLLGGTDRSLDLPNTEFFMGLQAALAGVGLNLAVEQTIVNIVLYGLEGFSFYYFMSVLFKPRGLKTTVIRLTGTTFYVLNFYQVYLWINIQIAPVATVIATPLTLAVITRSLESKRVDRTSLGVMLAAAFLGAPMGTEPPSLFSYMFITVAYFLFFSLAMGYWKTVASSLLSARIFLILGGTFVLANMYWILPSANFIVKSNYLNSQYGSQVYSVNVLLAWTTQYTSLLNVFRVLGDLFLYDSWGGQPYTPWFSAYETNIILVSLSFLLPLLAFAAPLVSARNPKVLFFSAFSLVILFLVKGIHEPAGWVYSWLVANLPGFWIFRAPWQHFFSVGILCLAFLGATTCGWIFQTLERRNKMMAVMIICIILVSTIAFNQVFISGKMIPTDMGDSGYHGYYNVGLERTMPGYVYQASDWVNSLNQDINIAVLPYAQSNVYDWGFAAASDFTPTLFNKGVLEQQYGQGTAPPNSMQLMYNMFATTLNQEQLSNASKILSLLNAGYVLERKDFVYNFYGGTSDSPSFIESQLNELNGLQLDKSFGAWDFYRNDYVLPKVYGAGNVIFVNGSLQSLYALTNTQYIQNQNALYFSYQQPADQVNLAYGLASVRINEQTDPLASFVNSTGGNFSWYPSGDANVSFPIIVAKDYVGSKPVISTNGKGTPDMIIFNSSQDAPYVFPTFASNNWTAFNSTLVYIQTGSSPLQIDSIYTDGSPASDVVGVWWESGWMGMTTSPITYPIFIPANEKAIIQINHLSSTVQVETTSLSPPTFTQAPTASPTVSFRTIDPTTYQVEVSTSHPFLLVFSSPYDTQWKAFYGTPYLLQLFSPSIPEEDHLMVNGYANGWYVNKIGNFTMTLYYTAQNLYYIGLVITVVFTILLIVMSTRITFVWRATFQRLRKYVMGFRTLGGRII
jgi:hypothetical protein